MSSDGLLVTAQVSFHENGFSTEESGCNHREEENQVLGVDHSPDDGFVMTGDAEPVNHVPQRTCKVLGNHTEQEVKKDPDQQCQQKRYDLVGGKTAGKYPDADVRCAHQQGSQVARPYCAMVDRTDRGHGDVIGQGKGQGDADKQENGQELTGYKLSVRYRLGKHELQGAAALLFGHHSHGKCRDKKEKGPVRYPEKCIQTGFAAEENVSLSEDPGEKACKTKKGDQHDIGQQGIEKRTQFPGGNDPYFSHGM